MTLEELDAVLTHPNIKNFPRNEVPGELNRERKFTIGRHTYTIEWWINMIYLKQRGLLVAADDVKQNGHWPNKAKTNLAFYREGKTIAVIELEQYTDSH